MKTTFKILSISLLLTSFISCKNGGDAPGYEDNSLDATSNAAENATDTLALHGRTPSGSDVDSLSGGDPAKAQSPNSTGKK